jgi:hypothetical protein
MTARALPAKGDRVVVVEYPGYKLHQNRPFECQPTCTCGGCNGTYTEYPGTVRETIYWADNSIESTVACDDGETRILRHKAPSGDVC